MRPCPQCGVECAPDHRFCPACGFPIGALRTAAGDPLLGRTLGGAYVVLENIGSGGMGRVYRAEQASLGKTVAVKVIHPHLISDESATARFYTEARAASRLNHPNSVSVLDFGRTDDGLLYLVMEYLRGKDLAHVLWEEGPLPPVRTANMVRQVLAALAEAHELAIIHRDVKPENILIEPLRTGGDFVKMVDFGLAKVRADVAPSVTVPGIVCGTPDYMAPEQGRGDPLDPRSDLYSCGVVLYQCLTGRLPFEADSPTQVVLMHMSDPPPDPRTFIETLPEVIVNITMKALSKDADDRFQSAVEFAETLATAVRDLENQRHGPRSAGGAPISTQVCAQCGAMLVPGVKFCSECGARTVVTNRTSLPAQPARSLRPSAPAAPINRSEPRALAFVGRDVEIAQLERVRTRVARAQLVPVRVHGEIGAGKARLVRAFLERRRAEGDRTIEVFPDVTWAGVAYAPVAQCVRLCLELAPEADPMAWLDQHDAAQKGSSPDRIVRAGFEELFLPDGAAQLDGRARRAAVVAALTHVFNVAAASAPSRAVIVVFEQLHRCDTATLAVLTALTSQTLAVPAMLIGTHAARLDPHWVRSESIAVRGLSREHALAALGGVFSTPMPDAVAALESVGEEILPLYVDQLSRWMLEGGGSAPSRLVDLISARLERLPLRARRAVQSLAVLGEADAATITAALGEVFDAPTSTSLRLRGWTELQRSAAGETFRLSQELLREVAEASIPAAARRELHETCAAALEGRTMPLEARALFAMYTADPFQSLILFERVGDRSVARGDDLGAAFALRRGLERARREMVRGEIDEPERAIAIFARKLGDALVRAGEASEAEGVLREALEVVPRSSLDSSRMQGSLARALFARGRTPDALRAIEDAVRGARRLSAPLAAAELTLVRAELDTELGNTSEAVAQLRSADDILRVARGPASHSSDPVASRLRIEILLRLARAMRTAGDPASAAEPVLEARELADRLELPLERARCDAEGAERAEALGDRRAASVSWRRAAQAAQHAGDGPSAALYTERARRLDDATVQGGAGAS